MDWAASFNQGLGYQEFLARYGADEHRQRWADVHAEIELSAEQQELLASFQREMNVLCLAGTWCGDCVNQCPVFDRFSAASQRLHVRFLDRDDHSDLADHLRICGGSRVPIVVFLSEDGNLCGIYGDRTLSKYRQMAADQLGPKQLGAACPGGLGPDVSLLQAVAQDWLNEFERMQWMLRTSPRLRKLHSD